MTMWSRIGEGRTRSDMMCDELRYMSASEDSCGFEKWEERKRGRRGSIVLGIDKYEGVFNTRKTVALLSRVS